MTRFAPSLSYGMTPVVLGLRREYLNQPVLDCDREADLDLRHAAQDHRRPKVVNRHPLESSVSSEAPECFHLGNVRPVRAVEWRPGRRRSELHDARGGAGSSSSSEHHHEIGGSGRDPCEHQSAWAGDGYNILSNRPNKYGGGVAGVKGGAGAGAGAVSMEIGVILNPLSDGARFLQRELASKRCRGILQQVFNRFGEGSSGDPFVHFEQLRLGLAHHGFNAHPGVWLEMFSRMNGANGDGRISLQEFAAALQSPTLERPLRRAAAVAPLERPPRSPEFGHVSSEPTPSPPCVGRDFREQLWDKIGLQCSDFKPIFRMFDCGGADGAITLEELAEGLARVRHTDDVTVEELTELMVASGLRTNANASPPGRVSFNELVRAFARTTLGEPPLSLLSSPCSPPLAAAAERRPPWHIDSDEKLAPLPVRTPPPGGWYQDQQKQMMASQSSKDSIGVGMSIHEPAELRRGVMHVVQKLSDNLVGGGSCQEMTPQPTRLGRRVVQPLLVAPGFRVSNRFANQIDWANHR